MTTRQATKAAASGLKRMFVEQMEGSFAEAVAIGGGLNSRLDYVPQADVLNNQEISFFSCSVPALLDVISIRLDKIGTPPHVGRDVVQFIVKRNGVEEDKFILSEPCNVVWGSNGHAGPLVQVHKDDTGNNEFAMSLSWPGGKYCESGFEIRLKNTSSDEADDFKAQAMLAHREF